jgi:hypothetical protein
MSPRHSPCPRNPLRRSRLVAAPTLLAATALLAAALLLGGCGAGSPAPTQTVPKPSQKASVGAHKDNPTQVPLSAHKDNPTQVPLGKDNPTQVPLSAHKENPTPVPSSGEKNGQRNS